MPTRVGFIGLGQMGKPIATNIQNAGFDLAVYDVRQEPMDELVRLGAVAAASPRELGARSEIIALAVPDDRAVEEALVGKHGALDAAVSGTVVAIHSTIHPDTARRLAARGRQRGVEVIDAQMSGGQTGARARTLCFMVGGPRDAFERCRPVLEASGENIFHMGDLGMGAAAKAAQQAITVVNILAAVEGFRIAETAGVDLESFQKLLAVSAGQSYMTDRWLQHYRPMATTDPRPFYRGLRAVLGLAFDLDVPAPATALAQQVIPWALMEQ
ncbi:MAG TPA: NAD(P)-dependent oxidoreductase [Chloroflexota bacterium]|nr:NAD(P)-dependent oxidoreductase [Chloroflexota bacterium]